MPKSQFLQSSFASGELSPLILGRTDLDQYYKGGQTAENVVIVPQGGIKRRPGTKKIDEPIKIFVRKTNAPTMPNGGTAANINDGNDETYGITNANLILDSVIAYYDFGSVTSFEFIDLKNISIQSTLNTQVNSYVSVEVSTDNVTWIYFNSILLINNEVAKNKRFVYTGSFPVRYVRLRTGVTGSENQVKIGEFNLKVASDNVVSNVKTFDFSVSDDEHYLGVLTDKNMRMYRTPHANNTETVYVADIITPYLSADIAKVRAAQTENVMLMFHKDYEPQRIIFNPKDTTYSFTSGPIPFSNVPQYDYNDSDSPAAESAVQTVTFQNFVAGDRYQIDVQGVLSKNISFGGDSESTAFNLQKNLQEMPIFGDTGITVTGSGSSYTITISDESAQPLKLFSGFQTSGSTGNHTISFSRTAIGVSRKEDVWSSTRGFPLMGAFSEGRLWIGGTKSKRQSLLASKSGDFFNFFSEEGADDDGIFITINSRNLTEIVDVNPDRGLQVFTAGAEFIVKGNTPSTIQIEAETQLGSFSLESKSLDGSTLFINSNGNTLRQYLYNFNEDAYTSNDISVLSSHLIKKPLDMDVLDGTSSEDSSWVFIINQDGTAAVLNTVRSQDINGFTKWQPYVDSINAGNNTQLKSCSVSGKELYVIAKTNSPNYPSTLTIEKWDFDVKFDSCQSSTKSSPSESNVIVVGSQFRGQTIGITANGVVLDDREVDFNGEITLDPTEMPQTIGEVVTYTYGYNIPVTFKSMPVNTNPGTRSGQNAMREKKITNMNLRVLETAGVYIDGIPVPVRELGPASNSPLDTPLSPKTGIIEDNRGGNGWSTEAVPLITVPGPTPFHLQSIEYEVESS
tara:strand:+ start:1137 stop:3692 length:2556 start_codon:yes stop_codon:yes gene_type:complete